MIVHFAIDFWGADVYKIADVPALPPIGTTVYFPTPNECWGAGLVGEVNSVTLWLDGYDNSESVPVYRVDVSIDGHEPTRENVVKSLADLIECGWFMEQCDLYESDVEALRAKRTLRTTQATEGAG